MKRGSAKVRLKQQIKRALTALQPKFELDYLKLKHPLIFNDCVASVLNEFGRKNMLNLDGTFTKDIRPERG